MLLVGSIAAAQDGRPRDYSSASLQRPVGVQRLPAVPRETVVPEAITGELSNEPTSRFAPPKFAAPPPEVLPGNGVVPGGTPSDWAAGWMPAWPWQQTSEALDENPHLADEQGLWFHSNQHGDSPKRFSDVKPGTMLQRLSLTGAWLPGNFDDDLSVAEFETYAVLGLPFPTTESPLLITPSYAMHFLDGPPTPDLPSKLYDASIQFRWLKRWAFAPWLMTDLAIEPGVHGDLEVNDADAFRLPGHGLAIIDWKPTTKLVLGVLYLDREDVNILPAGGIIITPDEDTQVDLVFPKPKLARRFYADGKVEMWNYVAAEFGGGPYSIRRASGAQDVIIWRDYRLFYGIERKVLGGLNTKAEAGYILGRSIEYINSDTPDYSPDPTLLLRVGVWY